MNRTTSLDALKKRRNILPKRGIESRFVGRPTAVRYERAESVEKGTANTRGGLTRFSQGDGCED